MSPKVGGSGRGNDWLRRRLTSGVLSGARLISSTLSFARALNKTLSRVGSEDVIVHAHDFRAAYVTSLLAGNRLPIVLTVHYKGGWVREVLQEYPSLRGTVFERVLAGIEARAVRAANVMVFTSNGSRELFDNEHIGLLCGKEVRVVYTGVDTEELDAVPPSSQVLERYGIAPETGIILCAGPLIHDKGPDVLIEAVAALPPKTSARLSCVIVGRGVLESSLKARVEEAKLSRRVHFLGFIPRRDLLQLMKSSILFVLPSRVSVFDYALLEAAAVGLPIVTTAVGGNLEMFDTESAILVPPEDPSALSSAIMELAIDARLRDRLGSAARDRIRSVFTLANMLEAYQSIFDRLSVNGDTQRRSSQ